MQSVKKEKIQIKKTKVAFTGGGTGGHVFPGLAVIQSLNKAKFDIFWIAYSRGMEREILQKTNLRFVPITAGKLRRYFSFWNFIDIFKIMIAFWQSLIVFLREKPQLLFSKGGFVSVPPVFAARLLRIPVFIHESDFDPGLASRLCLPFAEKIFIAYEKSKAFYKSNYQSRLLVSGNPVRQAFFEADKSRGLQQLSFKADKPLLLCMGGSSGAKEINDLIAQISPLLLTHCNILHQCGALGEEKEEERYLSRAFFYEEYPDLLAASDLVLSRAGAGSLWEFAIVGVPSLLLPLGRSASRGDQLRNAALFKEMGCSEILETAGKEKTEIADIIIGLLNNQNRLKEMKANCRKVASQNAAKLIADQISQRTIS